MIMWSVRTKPATWPEFSTFNPERVLDEYDGPRLFTVRSNDDYLLLAYQCAMTDDLERFLIVPADDALISALEENRLALKDALIGRGLAWLVDRRADGTVSNLGAVEPTTLPVSALPKEGVRLAPVAEPLLRDRSAEKGSASKARIRPLSMNNVETKLSVGQTLTDDSSGEVLRILAQALPEKPERARLDRS